MSQVSIIATIPPAALLPVVEQALSAGRPLRFLARVDVSAHEYIDIDIDVVDPEFDLCVGYSAWQPIALHQGLVEMRVE